MEVKGCEIGIEEHEGREELSVFGVQRHELFMVRSSWFFACKGGKGAARVECLECLAKKRGILQEMQESQAARVECLARQRFSRQMA